MILLDGWIWQGIHAFQSQLEHTEHGSLQSNCFCFFALPAPERRVENEQGMWSFHENCTQFRCPSMRSAISSRRVAPVLVLIMCIPFGLAFLSLCFCVLSTCVLILWVLPFLLLAASRRHSRSTSALSTAESVGQSGEEVLPA